MAPSPPREGYQSLPPILRKQNRNPKLGYSKAPRGLSVLMQVGRVFTAIPISPSLSPRQRSYHYAFRAGRNLPDKEFRYLRTVIVTAAVHWRFGLCLDIISTRPLTFQHWAGISPYTSPYGFAETCVFVKQLQEPSICNLPVYWEASLLPKLRDYFAEFLRESYLARFGLFSLSTCVGFSTIVCSN